MATSGAEEWQKAMETLGNIGQMVEGVVRAAKRKPEEGNQSRQRKPRIDDILSGVCKAGELYSDGAKVGAAQALTAALKSDMTEPIFQFLDKSLNKESHATSKDFLGCKVLVHRTDSEAGKSIERSKTMRPGFEGVLGAGIYFAEDEEATQQKTRHGVEAYAIVEARVDLGHCRVVNVGEREWRMICNGGFDKQRLLDLGFQSVGSRFNGGWEYCVFDPKHVQVLKVVQYTR